MRKKYVYLVVTDNDDYYNTFTYHEIFSSREKAERYLELEKANDTLLGYFAYIVKEILH